MTDFVPLRQLGRANESLPRFSRATEDPHFSQFSNPKNQVLFRETDSINGLEFSTANNALAVASSIRVGMYTFEKGLEITNGRFKDTVRCASFRPDGKLYATGDDSALIRIWDSLHSATTLALRSMSGHDGSVRITRFMDSQHIFSCSDDQTVRFWDIVAEQQLHTWRNFHVDYVRAGARHPLNDSLFVTGSYDHKICLWDTRQPTPAMTMDHGMPVESLVMYPSGGIVVSAGGNYLRFWDIVAAKPQPLSITGADSDSDSDSDATNGTAENAQVLVDSQNDPTRLSCHQKTIMSLAISKSGDRLISGGLDHIVRVYDLSSFTIAHTFKFQDPITAVALSDDLSQLAVGTVEGNITLSCAPISRQQRELDMARSAQYRSHLYSVASNTQSSFMTVSSMRQQTLTKYDMLLRKYQYKEALDEALKTENSHVIISMLEELRIRNGLDIAVSGRTENTLGPLLFSLNHMIRRPEFVEIVVHTINLVIDLYADFLPHSSELMAFVTELLRVVSNEVQTQRQVHFLLAQLDTLICAASLDRRT